MNHQHQMGGFGGPPAFGPGGFGPGGGRGGFGMERVFPVVRLRGLPFNAADFDILEFFQVRSETSDGWLVTRMVHDQQSNSIRRS